MPVHYDDKLNEKSLNVERKALINSCDDYVVCSHSDYYNQIIRTWTKAGENGLVDSRDITFIRANGIGLLTYYKPREEVEAILDQFQKAVSEPSRTKSEKVLVRMARHRLNEITDEVRKTLRGCSNKKQRSKLEKVLELKPITSVSDIRAECDRLRQMSGSYKFHYFTILHVDTGFFDRPEVTDEVVKTAYDLGLVDQVMGA